MQPNLLSQVSAADPPVVRPILTAEKMMRKPRFRVCAGVLLLLSLGCTRWESYPVPVAPAPGLPASLRVWTSGGAGTVLAQPFVHCDSLYGRSRRDTLGIALRVIERLERPRLDGVRTVGAVVGGVAGLISLGLLGGGWE
jgi:hypothetical protein